MQPISSKPPQGEPTQPESPEAKLADALAKYQQLCDQCGLELATLSIPPKDLDKREVENGIFGNTISTHDLLTVHSGMLSDSQREKLRVGIPKVYAAFEKLGFPNLARLRRKKRQDGGFEMYNPKVGIYFDELAIPGRNFGARVSLVNDSIDDIVQKLQEQIDNAEEVSSDVGVAVKSTQQDVGTTLS